jgi:hypothetical protein
MNKELQNRVFDIPVDILRQINHAMAGLNGQYLHGIERAKNLTTDKTVTYKQLKKIIHEIGRMDKVRDKVKYELCGGKLMETWASQFLKGERDLVRNRKEGRKRADNITDMTGERKNSYLKKHTKSDLSFSIPTNLVKSNSHKTSISPIIDFKLFEEIDKIKKLMI